MNGSQVDLAELFASAQNSLAAHKQEINDLDGYNGNHGDNMVQNVQMIVDALQRHRSDPPAAALEQASQRLQTEGRGGTSQYYAQGLTQAAQQLQGQSSVTPNTAMTVLQSLLRSLPSEGYPDQQPPPGGSVLDQFLGMSQQQSKQPQQEASSLGELLKSLLPAALHYFRARQAGVDSTDAVGQALTSVLVGSQHADPLQSGTPRSAAGGLVAQSMLQAILGGK